MIKKNEYSISDIYTEDNLEERIQTALEYYNVKGLDIYNSFAEQWAAYGYVQAMDNDLNSIYARSLACMLSGFIGGMPLLSNADDYIKEEVIEDIIIQQIKDLNDTNIKENELVKKVADFIISLYTSENIKEYEKVAFRLNTFLTWSENEQFERVKGKNNHEKIQLLLKIYYEHLMK